MGIFDKVLGKETAAISLNKPEEKKFLEDLQSTLQVSEELATKIVEVVVIKNRA